MKKNLSHVLLLCIVYAAFISLGLPDSVLGVAWPAMRASWAQGLERLGIITLTLTLCSALSGFVSARVLKKFGTGPVVLASCLMTGGALLGISLVPSFWWLIPLALPLGFGAGSVDAGLNHFVAEHYSSRHMNWLHGFWGVGATIGPVIMGAALSTRGWSSGYLWISLIQLSLAGVFLISLSLWKKETAVAHGSDEERLSRPAPGKSPRWAAWLGPFLYLVYAAVEVGTGLWVASILVEDRGLRPSDAGLVVSCFYGAIMGGRFLTGMVSNRMGNRKLVRLGLCLALAGTLIFIISGILPLSMGQFTLALTVAALLLLGLGCAPVYPGLMHETPRRYDEDTARRVVGRQVAFSYLGAALIPPLYGLLASALGTNLIMPLVACAAALLLLLSEILNRAT